MPASHLHKVEVEATLYKLGYLPPLETYKKKKNRDHCRKMKTDSATAWLISHGLFQKPSLNKISKQAAVLVSFQIPEQA